MKKPLLAVALLLPVPGPVSAENGAQKPSRGGELRVNSSGDPQYILPLGGEFRVNTTTVGVQRLSSIARHQAAAQPNFAITWESLDQDGSQYGVFAQRFVLRTPAGPEFRVNTYTTSDQMFADAATDSAGNFVVVWQSNNQDGDDQGIFAQRLLPALQRPSSGAADLQRGVVR